jgi:ankyrin repeat protein
MNKKEQNMFVASKQIKNYIYLTVACCSGMYLAKAMKQEEPATKGRKIVEQQEPHISPFESLSPKLKAQILLKAAKSGNRALVELFLNAGADVNQANNEGNTPLHYAASYGHKTIAELLLKAGANVNQTDKEGKAPLHYAAEYGHRLIVELLLDKGANARIKSNYNQTAAQLAVDKGYYDIAALLAKAQQEQYSKEHRDILKLRGLLKGYHLH